MWRVTHETASNAIQLTDRLVVAAMGRLDGIRVAYGPVRPDRGRVQGAPSGVVHRRPGSERSFDAGCARHSRDFFSPPRLFVARPGDRRQTVDVADHGGGGRLSL